MNPNSSFIVKSDLWEVSRKTLPPEIIYPFDIPAPVKGEEIIYWRKNYGLCKAIKEYCENNVEKKDDTHYIIKKKEEILDIIDIILSFMDEKVWNSCGESMWTYFEVLPYLRNNLNNLLIIMKYMRSNTDIYLEFVC